MKTLRVRNVQEALYRGLQAITAHGIHRESRAGPVLVSPDPVTTVYLNSNERVLFFPQRDANPFFHFMEGLWMLAGRNDVDWISQFSSNIAQFSDNGITFHGAYGKRWRDYFPDIYSNDPTQPRDQLAEVALKLRENPDDRRCIVQMWDPPVDLSRSGKDVPCNLMVDFQVNPGGSLDMMVFNRSNDIIWGAYGANAVHFSMLHEVMAAWVGVPLGRYWQVSANWHAYLDTYEKNADIINSPFYDPYSLEKVRPFPMVEGPIEEWFEDLNMFMTQGAITGFKTRFFRRVVSPMYQSWFAWKDKQNTFRIDQAIEHINQCKAVDWRMACQEWLHRRRK